MNTEVIVTCAITGAGDTVGRHPAIPVTPRQIADAAIEAAKSGATICHMHVRDPETGKGARDPKLYREVVDRIRSSGTDVVINLTAGMGGDLVLGSPEQPLPTGGGTDMAGATERLAHVAELLPEICTLDCGTMNFGEGDYVMTNTPAMLKAMAVLAANGFGEFPCRRKTSAFASVSSGGGVSVGVTEFWWKPPRNR